MNFQMHRLLPLLSDLNVQHPGPRQWEAVLLNAVDHGNPNDSATIDAGTVSALQRISSKRVKTIAAGEDILAPPSLRMDWQRGLHGGAILREARGQYDAGGLGPDGTGIYAGTPGSALRRPAQLRGIPGAGTARRVLNDGDLDTEGSEGEVSIDEGEGDDDEEYDEDDEDEYDDDEPESFEGDERRIPTADHRSPLNQATVHGRDDYAPDDGDDMDMSMDSNDD
eukprot:Clim_evm11s237 gene=Clim_evmTU11s237